MADKKFNEFVSGAVRDTKEGKGRYDLLPTAALKRVAVLMEKGAKHYGERNFEKGMPFSTYFSSALRHIYQALSGDESEDHLASACFNLMALMHHEEAIQQGYLSAELNDRPHQLI